MMLVTFDGYIPEDDYALVTIEEEDKITTIAFTDDEREAILDDDD